MDFLHGLVKFPMTYNKNNSPIGWYLGAYLLRFVELNDPQRNEGDCRFLSWENTVLVRAKTMKQAFSKVERIGKQASKPYRGGPEGVPVQWEYMGVTELLPIYEDIEDGAEIAWRERSPRTLRKLKELVGPMESFLQ